MELIKELPALGHDLGPGLIFVAIASLSAVGVACIYEEWECLPALLLATFLLGIFGVFFRLLPQNGKKPRVASSAAAIALLWGFIGLCGAIPFLFTGSSFGSVIFESMSAWTGTGFSVIENIEEWPHAFLFWRSVMQWIGGLGIVALVFTTFSRIKFNRGFVGMENSSDSFLPSVTSTAVHMLKIYVIITVIAFLAILCTGIGVWDSINLALCGISTGGLTMYSDGLSHYDNFALEMVLIPVMFLGAIPFRIYYLFYKKRSFKAFLQDRVLRIMLIVFVIISAAFTVENMIYSGISFNEAFREGIFMGCTAVTSTGFQTVDLTLWGYASLMILVVFVLIGGLQGSTSGGIKFERIVILFEVIRWWIRKAVGSSKSIINMRHDGKAIKDSEALLLTSRTLLIILGFLVLIIFLFMVLLHDPYFSQDFVGTAFDIMSCVGNCGVCYGVIGPDMPEYAKILLFFIMWVARLELIPFIILFRGIFFGFNWK